MTEPSVDVEAGGSSAREPEPVEAGGTSVREPRPGTGRRWLLALVLAVLYLVGARFSLLLSFPGTNASPIWPPSGVALAGLSLLGPWAWPAVTLAAFTANLLAFLDGPVGPGTPAVVMSLAIAAGNTVEAALGAYLARRYAAGGALDGVRDVGRYIGIALGVALTSAAGGTVTLLLGGVVSSHQVSTVALTWWLGDVTGMLVVAPFLTAWLRMDLPRSPHDGRWALKRVGLLSLTLLLAFATFSGALHGMHIERLSIYLAIPLLAMSAFWFDGRTTTTVALTWSAAAVGGTIRGLGPFSAGPLNDALILLDTFLALCSITGLLLSTDRREERVRARRHAHVADLAPSWTALLACLALTVAAWHAVSTDTERRALERFAFQFEEIKRRIEERLQAYEQILWGGVGLMRASTRVTREEWGDYVRAQQIDRRFPGIQGVGYALLVRAADKDAHEAQVRGEGYAGYHIRPAGARDPYTSIIYLEPFDWPNRRAFGYDMFSEPIRRQAMERARDTGRSALSGRVTLVQDTERDEPIAGFLMYVPVYRPGASVLGSAERAAALLGYVYAPFRVGDLMRGVLLGGGLGALSLSIYDGDTLAADARMFVSTADADRVDPHYRNPLVRTDALLVGQHLWSLRAASLPHFEREIDRQKAQIVLFAGALLSLLFFGMVRTLSRTRARALELAGTMTAALRAAESRFTSLANAAGEAILLLDADGVITSCNPGASTMFDAPMTVLQGTSWLTLVDEVDRPSAEAAFQALRDGTHDDGAVPRSLVVGGLTLSGRTFPLEGSLCSWTAEGHRLYGLIARDVSERKLAAEQLNASLALQISERKQREQEAQAALREKETLLKEVYHRVKNNLQVVSSLFNLQLRSLPDGPGRESLLEGAARVRAMALVHEKLYQSANLSSIQLGSYMEELCSQLAAAAAAHERGIRLMLEVEHVEAGPELAVPLGLLLNELVSNSFKHGFPDGRTGTILVALTRCDDGTCLLSVGDDGVGFAEGATEPSSRSLGLRLVRTLSRQLNAELELGNRETTGGAHTTLSFRVDTPEAA